MNLANSFYIYGNVPLDSAQVIAIVDHPSAQQQNIQLVNRIWHDHVVLFEGLDRGTRIHHKEYEWSRGLTRAEEIKGWDIPGYSESKRFFDSKYFSILKLEEKILGHLAMKKWISFFQKDSLLIDLLQFAYQNPSAQEVERICTLELFFKDLTKFISRIHKLIELAKIRYDRDVSAIYDKAFSKRQKNLMATIEEELQSGLNGKVIIFIERNLLLTQKINTFLQSKNCVAICSKDLPTPFPADITYFWPTRENPPEVKIISPEPITPSVELQEKLEAIVNSDKSLKRTKTSRDLHSLSPNTILPE